MEVKMDKHTEKVNDIEICTVPKGVLQYTHGVMEMSEYDKNLFHKVYREISEQLNFPVRFFDTQCVKEMIIKEYDGTNVKTLAKKYDYSEKSVRRIIKESTKKK